MVSPYDDWSRSPAGTPAPSAKDLARLQPSSSYQDLKDKPKKPRHRHSAYQLAALNELYDKDEHPPLEDRTELAERLGMSVPVLLSLCRYGRLMDLCLGRLQGGQDRQRLVSEQTRLEQETL